MLFEKDARPLRLREAAGLLFLLALSHGSVALAGSTQAEVSEAEIVNTTSIWDRSIPGSDETRRSLARRNTRDAVSEPVLLPLPAPVIAAGVGLGVVLLLRKKLR